MKIVTKHEYKIYSKGYYDEENQLYEVCDSISCLHALEHFSVVDIMIH